MTELGLVDSVYVLIYACSMIWVMSLMLFTIRHRDSVIVLARRPGLLAFSIVFGAMQLIGGEMRALIIGPGPHSDSTCVLMHGLMSLQCGMMWFTAMNVRAWRVWTAIRWPSHQPWPWPRQVGLASLPWIAFSVTVLVVPGVVGWSQEEQRCAIVHPALSNVFIIAATLYLLPMLILGLLVRQRLKKIKHRVTPADHIQHSPILLEEARETIVIAVFIALILLMRSTDVARWFTLSIYVYSYVEPINAAKKELTRLSGQTQHRIADRSMHQLHHQHTKRDTGTTIHVSTGAQSSSSLASIRAGSLTAAAATAHAAPSTTTPELTPVHP